MALKRNLQMQKCNLHENNVSVCNYYSIISLLRRFIRKQNLLFKNSTVFIASQFPIVKVFSN